MGKINPVSARKAIQKLLALGFFEVRRKGSHVYLRSKATKKIVSIPTHGSKDIPTGTLYNIVIKQAGLTADEFNRA